VNNFESNFGKNELLDTREIFKDSEPKVILTFTPENANEAKSEFLENDNLSRPNNKYEKLNSGEIENLYQNISNAILAVENDNSLGEIEREMYNTQLETRIKTVKMLEAACDFRKAESLADRQKAQEEFMKNNIEVYGEPDFETFHSLLSDKITKIESLELDEKGEKIRSEFYELIEKDENVSQDLKRFKPSDEVFYNFGEIIKDLYSKQLELIPEKDDDSYSAEEIFEVFENILKDFENDGFSEFDVEWKDSGAIAVSAKDKKIFIPKNRKPVSKKELEGLVVHEIGTHYMRAQMGEIYNNQALRTGLDGYMNTEEGIARAMEMAVKGDYREAGVQHYLTAGFAYFNNMSFRKAFETNWRMGILDGKNNFSEENIDKKRQIAYRNTQRIFRGTDELPWFKDLSYFNGGQEIWKYIEENIDSPTLIDDFLLGGKNDLLNLDQQRQIYELKVGKK
jgi:Domain of unknown function (DUF1704).